MNKTMASIMAKTQIRYNEKYYSKEIEAAIDATDFCYYEKDGSLKPLIGDSDVPYENVILTDRTTVDEIYHLREKLGDVPVIAALNFASFTHPGGQFLAGSMAQEESLCHKSILYNVLSSDKISPWYKHKEYDDPINKGLYHNCAIYTMDVVFNDNEREEEDDVIADIITVAAPFSGKARANEVPEKDINKAFDERIHMIFEIAKAHSVNILVLGAFGCGVFRGDPKAVATIFKNYLRVYAKDFSKVVFAIPNDGKNYPVFKKILGL